MRVLTKYILLASSLIVGLLLASCNNMSGLKEGKRIVCNLEHRTADKKFFVANDPAYHFSGGMHQTYKEAHSGKYSVVASKKESYVLSFSIENTGPDMFFRISVWRKSKNNDGVMVVSDKTAKKVYHVVKSPISKEKNGWEKLSLEFFTPPNFFNDEIKL